MAQTDQPLEVLSSDELGHDADDLGWHALNYRTAHTVHAQEMWQALSACVERLTAAAVASDRTKMLPLLSLAQEVMSIAQHGCTLDGDEVNAPTLLWAEGWNRRITGPNV